jgi:translation initiation factor IF-3
MTSFNAMQIAESKSLDLVKISPSAIPPVCKIMDYGKYKFDTAKMEKDARKIQKTSELKEMWLSMTIEAHDMETKAKQTAKFLTLGDKVKVSIRMRGRQQAHSARGIEVMNRFYELLAAVCVKDDKGVITEGRNIIMILTPSKK